MQAIKVIDLENRERDFKYVEDKYGVAFRRAEVEPGQPVYRLIELWEKTGHTSLISKVLDENGNPIDEMDVAFYWADAPDPPDPPTALLPHDWYRNFVHGKTNVNGDVGPGMGTGAYHGEGEGGPHAVWVRDPNIPSDICEKLGMLAGTFHDHLDQKFQLMKGDQPVAEGRFVETEGARTVDTFPPEGVNQNHISIKCGGEPNFYETRADLRVGEDWRNPDWEAPDPLYPAGLHHYNLGALYNPGPGETQRTFWVLIRHAGTEELISDPLSFVFNTGEGRRYATRVEWRTDGPPLPPTPPPTPPVPPEPPPDLAALVAVLKEIRDALWEIASSKLINL